MSIVREGIVIFGFMIHFYALLIITGAIIATVLAARLAQKQGLDPDITWDMMPWLLVGGIIGARLWHIFLPSGSDVARGITTMYYLTHPLDALNMRNGGLGIPGGVLGGFIAMWIYSAKKHINLAQWADFAAPGLAFAQAMGRVGNFINQELYGFPSTLPWAIYIEEGKRFPEYMQYETYHPLFLYEILWNLMNMGLLLWMGKRFANRLKFGDIFLTYLVIYPIGRFLLEYMRLDPAPLGSMNGNQITMAVVAVLAALTLILRRVIPGKKKAVEVTTEE